MPKRVKLTGEDKARRKIRRALLEANRNDSEPGDPLLRGDALPDKSSMEEALHVTCFECGYGAGRHSASCSRSR